ncbi:MAG: PilC/PilY family type IV pilus protein [Pseudomonadota bacterium]
MTRPGGTIELARAAWLTCALLGAGARAAAPAIEISAEPLAAPCRPRPALLRSAALVVPGAPGTAARVYQASIHPSDWSAEFTAATLRFDDAGLPQTAAPLWDAGAALTALADFNRRKIYTSAIERGVRTTFPFTWSTLSAAQRAMLDLPPAGGAADGHGEQRVDFLRGDRRLEGVIFRRRGGLLGDAVNSTPLRVGAPAAGIGRDAYQAFYDRNRLRRHAVYLGANDGMLHAFDEQDGSELFAYVPDALMSVLNLLPDPAYVHRAYVDGPAGAGEMLLGTAWKTVLVSAMGGGAQGVFALDVTDPANFAQGGGALWEFTDRDDAAMGNVTTVPQLARLRLRTRNGVPEYRSFAVVASGINHYVADGHADTAGAGALFLLALDKPASEAWRLNRNYYRLSLPAGDAALASGLSAPALVMDDDGALLYAYAGDLQGNLWRFRFTGSAPWSGNAGDHPLFIARDAARTRQPIAQQPRVVYAPDGGYVILFGTGKLLGTGDRAPAGFSSQSYYAVLDRPATSAATAALTRADLLARELDGGARDTVLTVRGGAVAYDGASGVQGWYVDFPNASTTGERSTGAAALADGKLFFNTVLPGADPCGQMSSRTYVLDALAGLAPNADGLPVSGESTGQLIGDYAPAPVPLETGRDSAARRSNGRLAVNRRLAVVSLGSAGQGAVRTSSTRSALAGGRISWREIGNWRELHRAAQR